ncbi:hypothetical protein CJJ23_01110 [Mycoplasmopsis agassizii]|uniref:Helicase/UvrB N-terminal domain-containing protein n=1 Tax=Mycoplasmopsis agassizii TaxID=33922 RepID=A0A269TL91_9BACT|nr:DEAD/DEAH box helicase family protein [Mycoplasmopsis agassizii]PAK21535.1 hypothetical protein CJJ23_01110 [Mycoplasmopsis agassizii]
MELTRIQEKAVNQIVDYFKIDEKIKVDFKAPTGSGKTLMAGHIVSKILEKYNSTNNFTFIIATVSSGDLPAAFEKKLRIYKKNFSYSKFEIEHILSPSKNKNSDANYNIKLVDNKLYIFGKASFGNNTLFQDQEIFKDFINQVKNKGNKLIYIRDEAHIGSKTNAQYNKELKKFEEIMEHDADFILKMTATPNRSPDVKFVEIKPSDLNDINQNDGKFLLKNNPQFIINPNKNYEQQNLLIESLSKFKKIQKEYKSLKDDFGEIRPALLIQVENEPNLKSKPLENKKHHEAIANIIKTIEDYNLTWVKYFGESNVDSNVNLKANFKLTDLSIPNSEIDVIIFKVGAATGWDIPRACMLTQLREVISEKLTIQTIGRIKRNPLSDLSNNEITNKYYIYSNKENDKSDFDYYQYEVKDQFKNEVLPVIKITNYEALEKSGSLKLKTVLEKIKIFLKDNKRRIIAYASKYFLENEFRKFSSSSSHIYNSIKSPFLVLREIERLANSKKDKFNLISKTIFESYDEFYKTDYLSKELKFKLEHLQWVILNDFWNEIKDIFKHHQKFEPNFNVEYKTYEPNKILEVSEKSNNNLDVKIFHDSKYFFNIELNGEMNKELHLDSKPEKAIFYEVLEAIDKINSSNEDGKNNITFWGKNLTSANISGEYLDNDYKIRYSYFDFMIKCPNNIIWYIEVKSENDINKDKTKLLQKYYKKMFENESSRNNKRFSHIMISIAKTTNSNEPINYEHFANFNNGYIPKKIQNTVTNTSSILKQLLEIDTNGLSFEEENLI